MRSSEKWLNCSWLVLAPLTYGDSSSAPTAPPPFGAPVSVLDGTLGNSGCPQQELESANSPLEGA